MKITGNRTIKSLKAEFHKLYPGLKIEFFKTPHSNHEGSDKESAYDEELLISDITHNLSKGNFSLDSNMRVAEVEAKIKQAYGLHVQIYRRSNDLWLQTISTDDWTLEAQNRKGLHSIQENTKLKTWISQ